MRRTLLCALLWLAVGTLSAQPISWPDWGPIIYAVEPEIAWTTDQGGTLYGAFATSGDAPVSVISVAPDGAFTRRPVPLVLESGQTLRRSVYLPATSTERPVVAVQVGTREGSRLYLHPLASEPDADAQKVTVGAGGSVEVALPDLGPRSWQLFRDATGKVELLFARNSDDGAEIGTIRFDGTLRPSPVTLLHSQQLTITDLMQSDDGNVIAWRSIPHAKSHVTVAVRGTDSLEVIGEVSAGLDESGASPESRTQLGLAVNDEHVAVALSYIERERTPLSTFWTGVRVALFDADVRNGQPGSPTEPTPGQIIDLVPASSGALYSSYDLTFRDQTLILGFLHQSAGASDFYVADLTPGRDGFATQTPATPEPPATPDTPTESDTTGGPVAVNVSQSPRRVAAPWLGVHEGRLRYLWLQSQPGGLTPIQAYREESWLRERLPLTLEGLPAETAVSAALSLPIAVVVGIFYALVGSAPALILAYIVLLLVQKTRPELMRSSGTWITSLVFGFCVLTIGLPPLSYAPLPSTLLPPLIVGVTALALVARWYHNRSKRALPTAAQIAGMMALGMVAVVSTASYEFVVEALRDPGWLPPTLGG